MLPNSNGAMTGMVLGLERISSHTYAVPSSSGRGMYTVYVESLQPLIYRCECKRYIFVGACKHGKEAVKCERHLKKSHPLPYRREKHAQKKHLAQARGSA